MPKQAAARLGQIGAITANLQKNGASLQEVAQEVVCARGRMTQSPGAFGFFSLFRKPVIISLKTNNPKII